MRSYLDYFPHIHSILRYFVLIFTLITAVMSLMGMLGKKEFGKTNRKMALFMLISCDLQLLAGLAVYYLGGHILMLKTGAAVANHYNRFYSIEHPVAMILGIILVHMGYNVTKKAMDSGAKLKRLFWFSFIAFVIFVSQTPWPGAKDTAKPLFPGTAAVVATVPVAAL